MNRPPTFCLFCGKPGDMSKQHVFPDRLRHLMPRGEGTRIYATRDRVRRNKKTIQAEDYQKPSQGSPGNHRIRRVCSTCNSGWLQEMEEECFPVVERLIRGESGSLVKADQVRLTRIALSIAMVGEWLSKAHVTTTQTQREFYRQTLTPPPNWYVFLGRDGTDATQPRFLTDGTVGSRKVGVDAPKIYSSFTFTMTPVLFHVISFGDAAFEFFDLDLYAEKLGLAAIYPPTDWINFYLMPCHTAESITGIRSYTGLTLRKHLEI